MNMVLHRIVDEDVNDLLQRVGHHDPNILVDDGIINANHLAILVRSLVCWLVAGVYHTTWWSMCDPWPARNMPRLMVTMYISDSSYLMNSFIALTFSLAFLDIFLAIYAVASMLSSSSSSRKNNSPMMLLGKLGWRTWSCRLLGPCVVGVYWRASLGLWSSSS